MGISKKYMDHSNNIVYKVFKALDNSVRSAVSGSACRDSVYNSVWRAVEVPVWHSVRSSIIRKLKQYAFKK